MRYDLILEWNRNERIKRDVIEVEGSYYVVDTHHLSQGKFETIIFPCDKDGEITNYDEVAVETYDTEKDALDNHERILKDKDRYIYSALYGGTDEDYKQHKLEAEYGDDDNEFPYYDEPENDESESLAQAIVEYKTPKYEIALLFVLRRDDKGMYAMVYCADPKTKELNGKHQEIRFHEEPKGDVDYDTFLKVLAGQIVSRLDLESLSRGNDEDDETNESKALPDAYDYIFEGIGDKIKNVALAGIGALTIMGATSCSGPMDKAELEQAQKDFAKVDSVMKITPEMSQNYQEVSDWVNEKMDSVYNEKDFRVYTGPGSKYMEDLFEKFIAKSFKTSNKLKDVKGTFPVFAKSVHNANHTFIYIPNEVTVDTLENMWDNFKKGNYTEYHWRNDTIPADTLRTWTNLDPDDDDLRAHYHQWRPGENDTKVISPTDNNYRGELFAGDKYDREHGRNLKNNNTASKKKKQSSKKATSNVSKTSYNQLMKDGGKPYIDPRHKQF